jgi:hypothetical protein
MQRDQENSNRMKNPSDYFSGHKKVFAINVQAAVDPLLRFRYVAVEKQMMEELHAMQCFE